MKIIWHKNLRHLNAIYRRNPLNNTFLQDHFGVYAGRNDRFYHGSLFWCAAHGEVLMNTVFSWKYLAGWALKCNVTLIILLDEMKSNETRDHVSNSMVIGKSPEFDKKFWTKALGVLFWKNEWFDQKRVYKLWITWWI